MRSIQAIARKRGYELLPEVLVISDETYMPITFIAFEACNRGAVAVVAPSAQHFGEQGEKLAHAVTLETLAGTVQRVGWDATR
ncbi:hypothetical protein [Nocardia salmonicida]|uniref:hypothetical protein n=1 Tax=Nocardia salmonicida TaxID=53431 RepID=UPI002E2C7462|nr:hypothetical protein [Nocardia salmonicida]